MKVKYNVEYVRTTDWRYEPRCEETRLLEEFMADPEKRNMVLEYDNPKTAQRKANTLKVWAKKHKMNVYVSAHATETAVAKL